MNAWIKTEIFVLLLEFYNNNNFNFNFINDKNYYFPIVRLIFVRFGNVLNYNYLNIYF